MTAAKKAAPAKKAAEPVVADPAGEVAVEAPVEAPVEPKAASKKGQTFTVKAPLIAVTLGSQVFQYTAGDVLPGGIAAETLDRLADRGFIAASE